MTHNDMHDFMNTEVLDATIQLEKLVGIKFDVQVPSHIYKNIGGFKFGIQYGINIAIHIMYYNMYASKRYFQFGDHEGRLPNLN